MGDRKTKSQCNFRLYHIQVIPRINTIPVHNFNLKLFIMVSRERLVRYPALLAVSILENPNQNNIDCHSSDLCKSLPLHNIAIAFPMKLFPSKLHHCEMFLSFLCMGWCTSRYILLWTLLVHYDKCQETKSR